jgi:hypothetical protein
MHGNNTGRQAQHHLSFLSIVCDCVCALPCLGPPGSFSFPQALVGVWGDKPSKNNSGSRLCFYAQELNAKLGRARGLDLHGVAARLEAGLYGATDKPLELGRQQHHKSS